MNQVMLMHKLIQGAPHSQSASNTLTLPDGGNGTLLSTVSTATVTNKTFTSPKINEDVAVTTTATEINLIDGGTSRGTTAVATGDGILINDGGTMRMTNVDTVSTYFSSHNVGGGNIVTTGALGSGSIAAGFGNIDNGASNITSGGLVSLDVDADADDVTGDSATGRLTLGAGQDLNLYHGGTNSYIVNDTGDLILKTGASDEDMIFQGNDGGSAITALTLDMSAAGAATFNSTVAATGFIIGSANIGEAELEILDGLAATTAELTIIDGNTSATGTTVADADRVVMNDNGTMVQVAVTDLAAYFDDEITAMPNLTSVGTLTALTVDNITINGNDISSTAGTDLTITPLSGQQIVLDGTIVVDAGVVTGATSITSTAFVGGLTGNVTGNASGTALTVTQAAQSAITSLGTLTALTVDNITIDGTEIDLSSGSLTVDVAGNIILDSGDGVIEIKEAGGDRGRIYAASSNLYIKSDVSDKDLIFIGNDGGSDVTALTLDMSEAGKALFNAGLSAGGDITMSTHEILFADNGQARFGAGEDLKIYHDGSNSHIYDAGTGDLKIESESNIYLGRQSGGGATMLKAVVDGTVELMHDNAKKFETTAGGIKVTNAAGTFIDLATTRTFNQYGTANNWMKMMFAGSNGNEYYISFRTQNNTQVGTITTDGTSTSYATSSDYRLKENVDYTFDATTRLKQLKPARFNFIADADKTVDGFIAHEVSSVVPEAVTGEKDAMHC